MEKPDHDTCSSFMIQAAFLRVQDGNGGRSGNGYDGFKEVLSYQPPGVWTWVIPAARLMQLLEFTAGALGSLILEGRPCRMITKDLCRAG